MMHDYKMHFDMEMGIETEVKEIKELHAKKCKGKL